MLPGFVDIYRDKKNFIHVFFFPGLDDEDIPIYKDIDMSSCNYKFEEIEHTDKSLDIKFMNTKIIKIYCKLISYKDNSEHIEELKL